jgi:hypothetical protein
LGDFVASSVFSIAFIAGFWIVFHIQPQHQQQHPFDGWF